MKHTITTITDARRIVGDMTENYLVPLTEDELETAARALVQFVGGYGGEYDSEGEEFPLEKILGWETA